MGHAIYHGVKDNGDNHAGCASAAKDEGAVWRCGVCVRVT